MAEASYEYKRSLAEGYLKHWTPEEGLNAIYHCYEQKAPTKQRTVAADDSAWYHLYFDLSDTPAPGASPYQVYFRMSGYNTPDIIPKQQKVHGLQLIIRPEVFERYFATSQDNALHRASLRNLLHPHHFGGQLPIPLPLMRPLVQLPRLADNDVMALYQVKGYIYEILSQFLQTLMHPVPAGHSKSLSGLSRLIEVNEDIAEATDQELPSLEDAARMACMCLTKFKKLFRLTYQTTYHKYHQRTRLMKAKELFRSADMNITSIVHDLGYKNAGHFARLFRECFHISPKEYQRQFESQY